MPYKKGRFELSTLRQFCRNYFISAQTMGLYSLLQLLFSIAVVHAQLELLPAQGDVCQIAPRLPAVERKYVYYNNIMSLLYMHVCAVSGRYNAAAYIFHLT